MPIDPIDHAITIDAPLDRVWLTVTEPALVAQWLGCMRFRLEVGAVFFMQMDPARRAADDISGATHCEIEAIEPPSRLRFSWFMPGTPKTHVELRLEQNPDGSTTARLVHSGWDQFDAAEIRSIRDQLDGGWSSFVLPGLKRVSEAA